MAEKLPLPLGEQQFTPPVMAAGAPPAAPMAGAGQEAMPSVMTTEQMNKNNADSVGAAPAPSPTSGYQQPMAGVEPAQGTSAHIAGSTSARPTTGYAPVAVMTELQPMAQPVQEQAAPVLHGLPIDPHCSTPVTTDQIQSATDVQVPAPLLHEHTQVSNALHPSAPAAFAREASPPTLFVPQVTKHERSDSLDLESASKRLKSEPLSSQASATSGAHHLLSLAESKAQPSEEHMKPNLVPSTPRDTFNPQVSTDVSLDDFQAQLLSAAAEEAVPKVVINAAIHAHDPTWPRNKPHHPGFHPNIPKIEAAIRDIGSRISEEFEQLKEAGYRDDIAQAYVTRLTDRVQQVAKAKDKEIVALLGNMGIGKSEAYEALVGQEGIAIKSDSGRGTHFPIEGHGRRPAQKAKIEVVAVWKTRSEFKNMVKTGCQDIYAYLDGEKAGQQPVDDIDDSDMENDNYDSAAASAIRDRQYARDKALKHLLPLLQEDGDPDFQDVNTLLAWFGAQKRPDSSIDRVVHTVLDRIMTLRKMHRIGESTNSIEANSAQEAAAILQQFSPATVRETDGAIRWEKSCHMKKAQLHLNNDMGAEGIVFADVPGRNDPDETLSEMIEDYIHSAQRYLVMAPAGRPLTKESDEYLREAIGSRKPTVFVVTKIDVKDDLTSKERAGLSQAELNKFLSAEARFREVQASIEAAEANKTALEVARRYEEAIAIVNHIEQLKDVELHAAKAKLHQLKVEARNRQEEADIRAQYQELAAGTHGTSNLAIVFVSAKEYSKHLRGEPTVLDYEATGIPKLFRVLYRSVADKRLEKILRLCHSDLPRQLTAIKHVLNKTPIERYKNFTSAIEKTVEHFEMMVAPAAAAELEIWTTTLVSAKFKQARAKHLRDAGVELYESWKKIRGGTFHALCRRYGDWKDRRLSREVQTRIAGDINQVGAVQYFDALLGKIRNASDSGGSTITDRASSIGEGDMAVLLFQMLETKLDELHFRDVPRHRDFLGMVKGVKLEFRVALEEIFAELSMDVLDIRSKTLSGGAAQNRTSYVGQAMSGAYEAAAGIVNKDYPPTYTVQVPGARGRTKNVKVTQASQAHEARVECFKDILTNGRMSVFKHVNKMLDVALEKARARFVKAFRALCQRTSEELLRDFSAFYVTEGLENKATQCISTQSLEEAVERVLLELPTGFAEEAEAVKNGFPAPEKGDIEQLIDECLKWEQIYPSEQRD